MLKYQLIKKKQYKSKTLGIYIFLNILIVFSLFSIPLNVEPFDESL